MAAIEDSTLCRHLDGILIKHGQHVIFICLSLVVPHFPLNVLGKCKIGIKKMCTKNLLWRSFTYFDIVFFSYVNEKAEENVHKDLVRTCAHTQVIRISSK